MLPSSRSSEAPFIFRHAVVAHANCGQRDGDGKANLTLDLDTRHAMFEIVDRLAGPARTSRVHGVRPGSGEPGLGIDARWGPNPGHRADLNGDGKVGPLNTMDGDGANKTLVPGDVHGEPSHDLHGGQRWYLELRFIAGEFYPDGGERRELFAVTEGGDAVQLSHQADLESVRSVTFGATRWTPDDAFVSWVALQWDAETGLPVDAGVYVAEVAYDSTSGDVIGLASQPADPMVPTAFVEDYYEVWRPLVRTHDWSPDQTAIVYDTVDWELFTRRHFHWRFVPPGHRHVRRGLAGVVSERIEDRFPNRLGSPFDRHDQSRWIGF